MVKITHPSTPPLCFPRAYECKRGDCNGAVVLFTSSNTGLVVKEPEHKGTMNLGDFSKAWINCMDSNVWSPVNLEITI